MPEAGIIETNASYDKYGAWAIVWKRYGGSSIDFRDCLLSFGFSKTPEEAIDRVLVKLDADPYWARQWQGGVFHPILISAGVKVPKDGWRRGSTAKVFLMP